MQFSVRNGTVNLLLATLGQPKCEYVSFSFNIILLFNSIDDTSLDFIQNSMQTPSRTPETMLGEHQKKRFTFAFSNAMEENVSQPWPVWLMISILKEFARLSKRTSVVMVLSRRTKMQGKSFSYRVTSEQT